MELKYSLDKKDYLLGQLYYSSKDKTFRKHRRNNWFYLIFIAVCLGLILPKGNPFFYIFLTISIIVIVLYPFYERNYQKRHYERHILNNYKNDFGKENIVRFTDYQIETFDNFTSESFNYSILEEINEIESHYFLKRGKGVYLIIPKKAIPNIEEFKKTLYKLKQQYNLKENIELNWKWK